MRKGIGIEKKLELELIFLGIIFEICFLIKTPEHTLNLKRSGYVSCVEMVIYLVRYGKGIKCKRYIKQILGKRNWN